MRRTWSTALAAALTLALALPAAASAGEWVAGSPNLAAPDWPGWSGPPGYGYYRAGPLTVTDDRGVTTLVYSDFIYNNDQPEYLQGVFYTRRHPGEAGFSTPKLVPGTDTGNVTLQDARVDADGNVTMMWEDYRGPTDRPRLLRTLKPDGTLTALQDPFPDQRMGDYALAVGGHGEVSVAAQRPIFVPSGNNRTVLTVARRRSLDGDFAAQDLSPTTGWRVDVHNIAMGAGGEAFVAWAEVSSDGTATRRARTRYAPPGGAFGAAVPLALPAAANPGDFFTGFTPAIDSAGRAQLLYRIGQDYVQGPRWLTVRSPGSDGTFSTPVKATEYTVEPQAVMSRDGDWTLVFVRDDGAGQAAWATTRRVGEAGFTETRLTPEGVNFGDGPRIGVGPGGDAMVTWGQTDIDGYVRLKSLTRPAGETAWGNLRTFTPAGHISHIQVPGGINVDHEGNALAIFEQDGVLKTRGYDAHGPHFDPLPSQAPAADDHLQFSVSDAWTGIASATWSLGDGATATGAQVDHVYASAGTYTQTVTAEDGADNSVTLSRQITVSGPKKPRSETAPKLSGRAQVDFALTADDGTWAGDPTSFSRQWQRCDATGAGCAAIAGATGTSYTLQAADEGHRLRVRVTATNGVGTSDPAVSAPTELVIAAPPHNLTPPTISGRPRTGHGLTATVGEWDGEPTGFTYQWRRCDAQGAACTDIAGATSGYYAVDAADKGHRLRIRIVATSDRGDSQPATSAATALITDPIAPTNTTKPSIAGDPAVGSTVTADPGQWTEEPYAYQYQWRRCNATGTGCVDIDGATTSSYGPVAADVGTRLRVEVRATNDVGTSEGAESDASAKVTEAASEPPANTGPPAISGTPSEGSELAASPGTWTGNPTSYSYAWLRCDATGANCAGTGATGSTYALTSADVGGRMVVEVRAANPSGTSDPARSAPSGVVAGAGAPVATSPPAISGSTVVGAELTGSDGTWTGSPTSYARQWQRCDANGDGCADVPGATGSTLVLTDADAGHTLRLRVTATNAQGSTPAQSAPTAVVSGGTVGAQAPVNTQPPGLFGGAYSGTDIATTVGSWAGDPTSFAISWLRCDAGGESCVAIEGAVAEIYRLQGADVGHTLRSVVVAANAAGASAPARSPASVPIAPAPADGGSGGGGSDGGGSGGGGSGGEAPRIPQPSGVVDLGTSGKLKLTGKGKKVKLGVTAACPASAAPAGCELLVTVRRGGRTISLQTVRLAAGATQRSFTVKLGKRDRKRARKKGLKLDVTVVGSIGGQKTSQVRRAGKVRAKKRR